jgi:hypothetical protein
MMMKLTYVLTFLCLLRFDEVLHIQLHHIKIIDERSEEIELILDYRKTHQEEDKSFSTHALLMLSLLT